MYELYVENKNGVYERVDLNDVPAMTYQSNNIGDLKDKREDFSMSINLEFTETNTRVFNYINEFEVRNDTPYRKHNCRLYKDGFTIAGVGAYIRIVDIKGRFVCQILSGISSFFTKLKDTPLETTNLGFIPRTYKEWLYSIRHQNWGYPLAIFAEHNGKAHTQIQGDLIDTYPFVSLKYLIENLVAVRGYKLKHNLDGRWEHLAVSLASLKPFGKVDVECMGDLKWDGIPRLLSGVIGNGIKLYFHFKVINDDFGRLVPFKDNISAPEERYIDYIADFDGVLLVDTRFSMKNRGTNDIKGDPEDYLHRVIWNMNTNKRMEHDKGGRRNDLIAVTRGDCVRVTCYTEHASVHFMDVDVYNRVIFKPFTADTTPLGGQIGIANNLGLDTQLDLFKAYLQLFGLIVTIDNKNKVVETYTLDKIYENMAIAPDWSRKLAGNAVPIGFADKTFAQVNDIVFKEDPDTKRIEKGSFPVDNVFLPPHKDLFSLPFQSGAEVKGIANSIEYNVPYIKMAEVETVNGEFKFTYTGGSMHLLELSDKYEWLSTPQSVHPVEVVQHANMQYFVDTFYWKLYGGILNNYRVVEVELLLDGGDVQNFNQHVPIYLEQYGAYFFVNRISNFGARHLTKCELVKL